MTLQDEVTSLNKRIEELTLENKRLQTSVDYLTRKLYGSHSEKTSSLGIEGQMSRFDEAETEADKNAPKPKLEDIAGYRRKKFKGQREELLKDLPHEKKLCTLDEADRFCMKCGSPLKAVGEEFIRNEVQKEEKSSVWKRKKTFLRLFGRGLRKLPVKVCRIQNWERLLPMPLIRKKG